MSVQKWVGRQLVRSVEKLDGTTATIDGKEILGVSTPIVSGEDLMMGGDGAGDTTTFQFPRSAVTDAPKIGDAVTLKSREWRVTRLQVGNASITMELADTNRRTRL